MPDDAHQFDRDTEEPDAAGAVAAPPVELDVNGWRLGWRRNRGECRLCGEPADSPRGTWCAIHRPAQQKPDPAPRSAKTKVGREPDGTRQHPGRPSDLEQTLRMQLGFVAEVAQLKCPECAQVAAASVPQIAEYLADQAAKSATVARFVEATASANGWLGAVMVFGPLVAQVGSHHVLPMLRPPAEHEHLNTPATAGEASANGAAAAPLVFDDEPPQPWDIEWRAAHPNYGAEGAAPGGIVGPDAL